MKGILPTRSTSVPLLPDSKDAEDDVKLDVAKDLPSSPPPVPPSSSDDDDDDDVNPPPLPPVPPAKQVKQGWTEHIDPATNYTYWENNETG